MIFIEQSSLPLLDHKKITDQELTVLTNVFSSIGIDLKLGAVPSYGINFSIVGQMPGNSDGILWQQTKMCLEIMCSMGYDNIYIFQLNSEHDVKILGKFVDIKDKV